MTAKHWISIALGAGSALCAYFAGVYPGQAGLLHTVIAIAAAIQPYLAASSTQIVGDK